MPADDVVRVVVFDVNIYLDIASLLGPPFGWYAFAERAGLVYSEPVPAVDPRVDSLRSIAYTISGDLAPGVRLEAWTSPHIDDLVQFKAQQPSDPTLPPESRGLGWSADDAAELVEQLVWGLVFDQTAGGRTTDVIVPEGNPPLSHEDGMVFAAARAAGDGDVAARFCVTRDREFREAKGLPSDVLVLYPNEYVRMLRQARSMAAMRGVARAQVPPVQ